MFDLLEHVPNDGGAAREALRVLRPGGFIVVSSPNDHWRFPYHAVFRRLCPTEGEMFARWGHVRRGYGVDDLERLFGRPPEATETFINPITSICHDLSFSKLPGRLRRGLCWAISPLTWLGYLLHPPIRRGTETAGCWRKPAF
jgi:hypothetical protein